MKRLIVLAIAVHLVSVQGSRINQQDLDYENLHDTGRDYISVDNSDAFKPGKNKDVLQHMGKIVDGHLKRTNAVTCLGSACKICGLGLCLALTHVPNNNMLIVEVSFHNNALYKKEIVARNWSRCQKIKAYGADVTPCIVISKMKIDRDIICQTVTVGIPHHTKRTFENICV